MAVRVNTLGKSAIINRQLNSAYDIVEYVADNLPLLVGIANKITLIDNIDVVQDHLLKSEIHLSTEDREFLEKLKTIDFENINSSEFEALRTHLETLRDNLYQEITDERNRAILSELELSDRINAIVIPEEFDPTTLSKVAKTGNYDDLLNKPVIDTKLGLTKNAVTNEAITLAINNKMDKAILAKIAYTGNYKDLAGKPVIEDTAIEGNTNAMSSGGVFKILNDIATVVNNIHSRPLSDDKIREAVERGRLL